ncbi:MAG: tail fiber domain-containing protein [Planctomycetota bacterium]|nr:tail fiber domain-containing protein [Planctomycetota bacterium]
MYCGGNLGVEVLHPAFPIEHSSGAKLTAGGVWTNASDRNLKENITPVDLSDVLARVVSMPVSMWNYKADAEAKHIGPMAQDFKQAFDLGDSDKVIGTVDADGVALAAIQGLNTRLEAKDAEIDALKMQMNAQNAANEARIKALEEAIAKVIATQKEGAR